MARRLGRQPRREPCRCRLLFSLSFLSSAPSSPLPPLPFAGGAALVTPVAALLCRLVQAMWCMEAAAPRPFSWALFPTLLPAFPALWPPLLACFQGCACVLGTEIAFCAIRHTLVATAETVRHSQAELVIVFVAQYNVWGLHRKLWVHHGWLMHMYPQNPTQILMFVPTPL